MTEPVSEIAFRPWPKTPRLFRDMVITEKIDGTNAAVIVTEHPFGTHADGVPPGCTLVFAPEDDSGDPVAEHLVAAQSRKRLITLEADNFGFAAWVHTHAICLAMQLGAGHHYGEWWGHGIQRGYGLKNGERRFSLFNVRRYHTIDPIVPGLGIAPVLYEGPYSDRRIRAALAVLNVGGSVAAPGYMNPEGIIVYHISARQVFKVTLDNDGVPKGGAVAA